MRWPSNPLTHAPKTGQPKPHGRCAHVGCISLNWYPVDGGLVRQCAECRTVTTVIPIVTRGIDATCSTDQRPSSDFDGCTE